MTQRVAVVIPSCNFDRVAATSVKWAAMGYDVFLYLSPELPRVPGADCIWGRYPGWYSACNILAARAATNAAYGAIVCAGDDMDPDPTISGPEICTQCYSLFGSLWVMQPTGDDLDGTDRICGSPWLSTEWRRRAYGGKFPMPGWYGHFYGDEELLEVSRQLGCLFQRRDLCQRHHHWTRRGAGIAKTSYQQATHDTYWHADQALFINRRDAGWPEMGLL